MGAGGLGERVYDDLISSWIADLLEKEAVGYSVLVFCSDMGQQLQVPVLVQ